MHSRPTENLEWPPEKIAAARTIQRLMEFWQIKPSELATRRLPEAPQLAPAPARPRYRHPVSGETWDGQGSQPPWLRQALLKEGYLVEELRVADDEPVAVAVPPPATANVAGPAAEASSLG
ncbi:MAG: H-NS family nucleoid-associated regulatory protein [Pseudomonadota bacterium]